VLRERYRRFLAGFFLIGVLGSLTTTFFLETGFVLHARSALVGFELVNVD
jgi:hypothetical protein